MRFGINLVTVVFNNSSYGNVLRDQRRMFDGRHSGAELTNPDFRTYAKAFGAPSWRVADGIGLRNAVKEALAANAPCLIEVITDITKESEPWRFITPARG
jgi:acetolactate synthase-1/2/3 large subunit